jgi:hypothetical protein
VKELDAELRADVAQRLRDVGRPAIDVVRTDEAILEEHLPEAILSRGVLAVGDREVAVEDRARRVVDLREEDDLAELAVGADDRRVGGSASPTTRSPACSAMKFRRSADASRTGSAEMRCAASRRWTVAFASAHWRTTPARSSLRMMRRIERRGFSLFARTIRSATSEAIARETPLSARSSGRRGLEPAPLVILVPGLDRARGEAHDPIVGRHDVGALGGGREVCGSLEPCADERPEHADADEGDRSPRLVIHGVILEEEVRRKGGIGSRTAPSHDAAPAARLT